MTENETQPTRTVTALALPFPMRPGYLAQVVVPRDLTKPEADRFCAFIMSLAVPLSEQEQTP